VRVKGLSRALAQIGYQTYLYFCGDPDLPARKSHESGRSSTADVPMISARQSWRRL